MTKTPCDDYVKVRGVVFFARMLDKIRLNHQGLLPPGYNLGFSDSTSFDARFCRFWTVDYDWLVKRTLAGGTDEEIFDDCFKDRLPLIEEQVLAWNNFLLKRGWRDETNLQEDKEELGLGHRDDILTYVDLHDADEGRKPRFS